MNLINDAEWKGMAGWTGMDKSPSYMISVVIRTVVALRGGRQEEDFCSAGQVLFTDSRCIYFLRFQLLVYSYVLFLHVYYTSISLTNFS